VGIQSIPGTTKKTRALRSKYTFMKQLSETNSSPKGNDLTLRFLGNKYRLPVYYESYFYIYNIYGF